ncbi:unnamed protein product, partial [Rotaria sp. Silwood1]
MESKIKYNLRRLHPFCINLNRYDFAHPWTIFDYDFLSTYLGCGEFKMSDLLYQFYLGSHDPNGELRFLLKQFETSSAILDQYPDNLACELAYRFSSLIHLLPDLTYNLFEQCLSQCSLVLITNSERQSCLAEHCMMNNSRIVNLTIDSSRK